MDVNNSPLPETVSGGRPVPWQGAPLGRLSSSSQRVSDGQFQRGLPSSGENRQKQAVEALLREVGVTVNGPNPWDIQVHDDRFYDWAFRGGELGVGESYAAGWWDCERLDELACRVLSHDLLAHARMGWRTILANLRHKLFNLQTRSRAMQVAEAHYDLSNDFFEQMLGPTMAYSCGYWRRATNLDQAQDDKHDLICRKLQLAPHDRVLDIGCGWGAFAKYAARKYGCHVTGITISEKQYDYAREFCAGLPVDVFLYDYRAEALRSLGPFDKVVSVGMFEHVGRKNYRRFMAIVHDLLSDTGLFLLHAIGASPSSGIGTWVERYIFPNSELPFLSDIVQAIEGLFVMEDWQNFGAYYDKTLLAWNDNVEHHPAARELLKAHRAYRRWRYYLLTCAGSFRLRSRTQLWQIVLSKNGVPNGYISVR
jgi:cyclopropane-fatty-acyl-phospholipid synthase